MMLHFFTRQLLHNLQTIQTKFQTNHTTKHNTIHPYHHPPSILQSSMHQLLHSNLPSGDNIRNDYLAPTTSTLPPSASYIFTTIQEQTSDQSSIKNYFMSTSIFQANSKPQTGNTKPCQASASSFSNLLHKVSPTPSAPCSTIHPVRTTLFLHHV